MPENLRLSFSVDYAEFYAVSMRSMSMEGCSPDNAACEGFFGRMKNKFVHGQSWVGGSLNTFRSEIDYYINWYNQKRIKLSLRGLSPTEYRRHLYFST